MLDNVLPDLAGITIERGAGSSFHTTYQVVDNARFETIFGKNVQLQLIETKPKDIAMLLAKGIFQFAFNYSIMMQNYPIVAQRLSWVALPQIKVALICTKDRVIDPHKWTPSNKGLIASEYQVSVNDYFKKIGIKENCYTLMPVTGSSQSYVQLQRFHFCDAIVSTGRTVKENGLQIRDVVSNNLGAGFYRKIQ